jgi:hypothetical protein
MRIAAFFFTAIWLLGASVGVHAAPLVAPCTESTVTAAECDPINSTNPLPVVTAQSAAGTAGFPAGATPINAAAGGTTAATAATLAAAAGKFTYVCGFSISHGSATGAVTAGDTVVGTAVSMTWVTGVPVTAAGTTTPTYTINFSPCIPSSAVNTGIVVTSGANGAGGVNNFVQAWGYQK